MQFLKSFYIYRYFADIINDMDPSDLVGEEGAEEMETAEQEEETVTETAVAVPEAGAEPGALETLVAGIFERVAVGVLTSVVQAEVKELMVRYLFLLFRL